MITNLKEKKITMCSIFSALSIVFGVFGLVLYCLNFERSMITIVFGVLGVAAAIAATVMKSKALQYVSFCSYLAAICYFVTGLVKTITDVVAGIDASGFSAGFIVTAVFFVLVIITSFAATITDY